MLTWKEEHKVQLFLAFPHSASDLGLKVKFQGLHAGHPQSLSSHASAGGSIPSSGLVTDDLTVPKGKKKVSVTVCSFPRMHELLDSVCG